MNTRSWTNSDLCKAVAKSKSIAGVIRTLGLVPAGGNYTHIQRQINALSLDTSHFTGKGWRKNLSTPTHKARSLESILQ